MRHVVALRLQNNSHRWRVWYEELLSSKPAGQPAESKQELMSARFMEFA